MVECKKRIQDFEDIRQYVTETLSDIELLRPDSSQLTLRLLKRSGTGGQAIGHLGDRRQYDFVLWLTW